MAKKGEKMSLETRNKISIGIKKFFSTSKGDIIRKKRSEYMTGKEMKPETRAKLSNAMKGQHHKLGKHVSAESRDKMSKAKKQMFIGEEGEARRLKMSLERIGKPSNNKGKHISQSAKDKIRKARSGIPRKQSTRIKISGSVKELWKNPIHRDKLVKLSRLGHKVHPNKPEKILLSLLLSINPNSWKFVGDGKFVVAGKNPDFWNGDHKLAELYGDYFHKGQNPQDRIDLFKKYGYDCLVIWENELKSPQNVLEKIRQFHNLPHYN